MCFSLDWRSLVPPVFSHLSTVEWVEVIGFQELSDLLACSDRHQKLDLKANGDGRLATWEHGNKREAS